MLLFPRSIFALKKRHILGKPIKYGAFYYHIVNDYSLFLSIM